MPNENVKVFAECLDCYHRWQICGAKQKAAARRGELVKCSGKPMPNGRCRMHGGNSVGAPLTAQGRRSKYLPVRLLERVTEALDDPDLVALTADIALMDALITERTSELGENTRAELWGRAGVVIDSITEDCIYDPDSMMHKMAELAEIVENGKGIESRIREIINLTEQKRKLADTEVKRMGVLNQFVSARELAAFTGRILEAIETTVKDRSERQRLGVKIASLLGIGNDDPVNRVR